MNISIIFWGLTCLTTKGGRWSASVLNRTLLRFREDGGWCLSLQTSWRCRLGLGDEERDSNDLESLLQFRLFAALCCTGERLLFSGDVEGTPCNLILLRSCKRYLLCNLKNQLGRQCTMVRVISQRQLFESMLGCTLNP